jgi:hypothetical protein
MKNILAVLIFCSGIAFGGSPRTLIHPTAGSVPARPASVGDTLRILAIMVQFQKDSDPNSTGNGQFDLTTTAQRIIDAPPRDSAYFADHFLFAQNYFRKVSRGRQAVAATVLGTVITLRNKVQVYAPAKRTAANTEVVNLPLTNLIDEAWHAADSLNPGFPFHHYDLFVIFHAGPGKDVNLEGNVNYDLTPYDLPSLYFNLPGLQKLRGASYAGVPLKNNFTITNSIILPETENRMIASGASDYLLQLSINGLVVANIASALGLPDLFNTRTGGTAIGRFGLMDGQSIFSYFGLFPPEPSAWERAYLGWADPVTLPANSTAATMRLTAGSDTIVKVPISAKEYFLLENRQRDRNKDGQTLTIRWNGQEFTKKYLKDDDHFNASSVDSIYGTVVDADEFDWSLPGLINDKNNYHGGILIWHIDETVIEKNLATNSINADENHRGVDLEEADGSQDIGQSYGFLDAGSGTEDGSPLDYWFLENLNPDVDPVYKNEFSETSHPNSLSNTLAKSHITIKNFSASAPVMSFDVLTGDGGPALVGTFRRAAVKTNNNDAPIVADINGDGKEEILYTSGDAIYALQSSTLAPFPGNPTGLFATTGGAFQPVPAGKFALGGQPHLVGIKDSSLIFYTCSPNGTGTLDGTFNVGARISTPAYSSYPIAADVMSSVTVGTENGTVADVYYNGGPSTKVFMAPIRCLASAGGDWFVAAGDSLALRSRKNALGWPGRPIIAMSSFGSDDGFHLAALFTGNGIIIFSSTLSNLASWTVPANVNASLALYDVNGDGRIDIVVGTDKGVYAYNTTGALIEHFPLKVLDGGSVVGSPIVVRKKTDGTAVICFGSTAGQVYAYGTDGTLLPGFPLQTGGMLSSLTAASQYLIGASADSSVYAWNMNGVFDLAATSWSNYLGNAYHTNFIEKPVSGIQKSDELMPKAMAYNWPNPVYDKTTHIRYYLGKQATVTVKIFTLAGESVATLHGSGNAHSDNEIEWDVSGIQSGVYFAQLEAASNGETSSTIIKIAVVK